MGYLQGSGLDNMDTATVSFWFRVPNASFQDAIDSGPGGLNSAIALFVFGNQGSGAVYGITPTELIADTNPDDIYGGHFPTNIFSEALSGPTSTILRPSYIGVNSNGPGGSPSLEVWLQTGTSAIASGLLFISEETLVNGDNGLWDGTYHQVVSDGSIVITGIPEVYGNVSGGNGTPPLRLDRWQHVLLSWKLGMQSCTGNGDHSVGGVTSEFASTEAKMYCAVNNINKDGFDLPCGWIGQDDGEGDRNAMLTNNIGSYAGVHDRAYGGGAYTNLDYPTTQYVTPSMSFDGGHLDVATYAIPGPSTIDSDDGSKSPVFNIEMAELYVFPGLLLDTSSAVNRRLFVTVDGKPADPTALIAEHGTPAVMLRGKEDWKAGNNTGSGGDLSPVGTITDYLNDPSLGA